MKQRHGWTTGFTLFEFIIVIIIISVLAAALMKRIPYYQEQAEKAAMEQVAAAIQGALVMRYGSMLARGKIDAKELQQLREENPLNWLQQKPQNFAGEFFGDNPQIVPGQWWYDLSRKELVYLSARNEYLKVASDHSKSIRFHVKFEFEPVTGRTSRTAEPVATLFVPIEPYHWLDQGG